VERRQLPRRALVGAAASVVFAKLKPGRAAPASPTMVCAMCPISRMTSSPTHTAISVLVRDASVVADVGSADVWLESRVYQHRLIRTGRAAKLRDWATNPSLYAPGSETPARPHSFRRQHGHDHVQSPGRANCVDGTYVTRRPGTISHRGLDRLDVYQLVRG